MQGVYGFMKGSHNLAKDSWNPFLKFKIIRNVKVQIFTFTKCNILKICSIGAAKRDKKSRNN
jgi:hypothetical protein